MFARDHIHTLTGLRGVAALWVVLLHGSFGKVNSFPYLPGFDKKVAWGSFENIVSHGYYAVDLFFILSGFIIPYVYVRNLANGRDNFFSYMIKRFARLYPAHAFITLALAGAYSVSLWQPVYHFEWWSALLSMGLMNIWKDPSINIPAWSISAEFFAYLSFPVIWFMIGKAKGKIVLLSIIFSLIFVYVSGIAMVIGMHWHYGLGAVFRVLCGFSIGCVLYRLYSDKICVFYTPVHNDHVFITCVIGLFVVLFISLPVYFVYPFLPFIIFYLAVSQGYVKVFFSSRPMVYLGMISYSVYLVHYPVLEIYRILLNDYFAGLDMVSDQKEIRFWMTAIVVSVLIAAALIYHGIEEPCRRWIRKRFLA